MAFTCDFVNFFIQRYRLFQQPKQEIVFIKIFTIEDVRFNNNNKIIMCQITTQISWS